MRELEQNNETEDDEQVTTPEVDHVVPKSNFDVRTSLNNGITRSRPVQGASLVWSKIIADGTEMSIYFWRPGVWSWHLRVSGQVTHVPRYEGSTIAGQRDAHKFVIHTSREGAVNRVGLRKPE